MSAKTTSMFTFATQRFANTAAGIAELLAWIRPHAAERIVFESTGPYQKAAVGALLAEGLPVVVVNARQVRDFAKAMNYAADGARFVWVCIRRRWLPSGTVHA